MEAPGYLTGGVESIPCKELLSASAQPGCAVRLDEALPHCIPSSTEAWRPLWPALHPRTNHNTHVSFQGCWLSRAGQKGVTISQQTWDTDLLEREWRQVSGGREQGHKPSSAWAGENSGPGALAVDTICTCQVGDAQRVQDAHPRSSPSWHLGPSQASLILLRMDLQGQEANFGLFPCGCPVCTVV